MNVIVADEWMGAALVRGKVQTAKDDVAEVDVEAAVNADETKEQNLHIRKFDRLNYSIESVICDLEEVAEFPFLCRLLILRTRQRSKSRSALTEFERALAFSL